MPALKTVAKCALAALFVAAGVAHFAMPDVYVRAVPPSLPYPRALVLVSGAFELLGGVGLLVPRLRVAAAWGLIALLVAVFPANVHMALHPEEFPRLPPAALWARLPFQAVLVAWAYWLTQDAAPPS